MAFSKKSIKKFKQLAKYFSEIKKKRIDQIKNNFWLLTKHSLLGI
jgi:hypothetical protein